MRLSKSQNRPPVAITSCKSRYPLLTLLAKTDGPSAYSLQMTSPASITATHQIVKVSGSLILPTRRTLFSFIWTPIISVPSSMAAEVLSKKERPSLFPPIHCHFPRIWMSRTRRPLAATFPVSSAFRPRALESRTNTLISPMSVMVAPLRFPPRQYFRLLGFIPNRRQAKVLSFTAATVLP